MHRPCAAFAVTAAVALCVLAAPEARAGGAEIRKAVKAAKDAVSADDSDRLAGALDGIVAEDGKTAAKELLGLLEAFPKDKPRLYWQVISALTALDDPKALDAVGDWILRNDDDPLATDILFGLQNNKSPLLLENIYGRILKKGTPKLRALAVDRLGEMEKPEAVDLLLTALEAEDGKGTTLERRILSTLRSLFGEDMGDLVNWQGWWEQNRETAFSKPAQSGGSHTGTVKDELDRARSGGLNSMSRRGGRVIVLRGQAKNFDEIEKMLARLEVKHEVLMKKDFMDDMDAALKGTAAIILNCNFYERVCRCPTCKPAINPKSRLPMCSQCDKHDFKHDMLNEKTRERIKRFVAEGGSVFTEDLGLKELTGKAWPEYVVATERKLKQMEVDYAPVPGQAGTPLLRGVFARKGGEGASSVTRSVDTKWKVDDLSPAIKVVDASKVTVLLASEKLKEAADGDASESAVAVTFEPGASTTTGGKKRKKRKRTGSSRRGGGEAAAKSGIVLHVLSHFGKQKTKEDEFTLQNLLVNFLLEAQERYAASKR
jgi:hypothetical protein